MRTRSILFKNNCSVARRSSNVSPAWCTPMPTEANSVWKNQSTLWQLKLIWNYHPVACQRKSDQICNRKTGEWLVMFQTNLAGRDQGKVFFFASFSIYSFINCSAVPNTPQNKINIMKWNTIKPLPFLVGQKIRIGLPTEYCCRVENNL
jgi:hypothetical protein